MGLIFCQMFPQPKNQEIFKYFHHYWCTPLFFFTMHTTTTTNFETKLLAIMMMTYGPLAIFVIYNCI